MLKIQITEITSEAVSKGCVFGDVNGMVRRPRSCGALLAFWLFGFLHASGLHNPSLHRGALVVETSSPCFRDYLNEPSK